MVADATPEEDGEGTTITIETIDTAEEGGVAITEAEGEAEELAGDRASPPIDSVRRLNPSIRSMR